MIGKIVSLIIILNFQFIQHTKAGIFDIYCSNYNWEYYDDDYFQNLEVHSVSQFSQQQDIKLGVGFWFSYRPLDDSQQKTYQQVDSSLSSIKFFLYKFQNFDLETGTIFFSFLEIDTNLKTIEMVTLVQTQDGYIRKSIKIQNFYFDGDWTFIFFFMDQKQKKFTSYYFSNNNQQYSFVEAENFFQLQQQDFLISTWKFYVNEIIDGQDIQTKSLPAVFFKLISTTQNLFSDLQSFQLDCLPIIYCYQLQNKLIQYNIYFSGLNSTTSSINQIQNNYFQITGWVKQELLVKEMKLDSLLLRITSNEQFFDDSQIGDRLLYVIYHQSLVLSKNGFTFETYSYELPIKLNSYSTQQSDIMQYLSPELQDVQTNWHFFQYYEGSIENNGFPFVRIYYPTKDQTFTYKWTKDIHHFTNLKLYFHIGGDDYFQNQFKGYLSDWKITTYCSKFQIKLDIPCHYTCLTCKGISSSDCLSCSSESNRLFSQDENKCVCPIKFIDLPNVNRCQQLNEISLIFQQFEVAVQCDKIGQYYCQSEIIECDYGYFKFNQNCLQCPHYEKLKSEVKILCPNCYIYPNEFAQNPSCLFYFTSNSQNQPFSIEFFSFLEQESYIIKQDDDKNYFLQLQFGSYIFKNKYFCKPGYFENLNQLCEICPVGCSNCYHTKTCVQCKIGYYMIEEQQCKLCEMCEDCEFENGKEYCYFRYDCAPQQYQFNYECHNCGDNCQTCSVNQCYYCVDNSKYYITLDRINCSLCPIKNCKYCFDYIKSQYSVHMSFDIDYDDNFDKENQKVKLGCAQCYDGLYYSFETEQCEQKPQNEQECQVGLFLDESNTICIKSQSLSDSIQSQFCSKIANCLECINNYTLTIQQYCIICQEGYYSTVQTGQCKLCPLGCKTCAQQHKQFLDYWKWDIKAFYKYFANSDGNHPFETYAAEIYSDNYQITCLSCANNYLLYNQECIAGCDENCLECHIVTDFAVPYPYSECLKCKSSIYNQQRSLYVTPSAQFYKQSICLQCAPFCEACYPRTKDQINAFNPFFDQTSKYLFYSHICYKYIENSQYQTNMLPKYFTPQICKNSKNCQHSLDIKYFVYCDANQIFKVLQDHQAENERGQFIETYGMMILGVTNIIEKVEFFDYFNQNVIQVVNFKFSFQKPIQPQSCLTDYSIASNLINNLRKSIFYLNTIVLNIFGDTSKIEYQLTMELNIKNFDKIIITNFNFLIPQRGFNNMDTDQDCNINFLNDNVPMEIVIQNCDFTQIDSGVSVNFQMTSNRPKFTSLISISFIKLKVNGSSMFSFSPLSSENNSIFLVKDALIDDSIFNSTSVFLFQAVNNSLNYKINMTQITLLSSTFNNSIFINTIYKQSFDIGFINLENIHLENLTFQQNSVFLQILSAQQIICKNITLKNVKFYDSSSFFIGNTFQINMISFLSCYIEQGHFITNNGEQSKSLKVSESSNQINFLNLNFEDITYVSEKSFIYIVNTQSNLLELKIQQLKLNDCKYVQNKLGEFSFDNVFYKFSVIYIECFKCVLEDINIIRGYGRPEISIVQSQNLEIKNIYITLKKDYYHKTLHQQFKCIRKFNNLNMYFALFISSYHIIKIEDIVIEKLLIFDYPIIQIEGVALNEEENIINYITLNNGVFVDNILIITQLNKLTSIISISSQSQNQLYVQNTNFSNNIVNKYEDDIQMHSSTTLKIEFQVGDVTLLNTTFFQNAIYNSTDSVLYVKTSTLTLQDCLFQGSNTFNSEIISKNVVLEKKESNNLNQTLKQLFFSQSQGGSGLLLLNQLSIANCQIKNSKALNGGSFYIITGSYGEIYIDNTSFFQTSTLLLSTTLSSGGALYIDSSKSQLNISIRNSSFDQTFSRTFGGAIFIDASKLKNEIIIHNVSFIGCFSFQHSVISFQPSQLQQLSSNLIINGSYFQNTQENYELYISQIQDFSDLNIEGLQYQNPLIYSQFCNFTIFDCIFQQIHLSNLIQIEKGINMIIEQLSIENCVIFYTPLIQISNRENFQASLVFRNIKILNTQEFSNDMDYICSQSVSFSTTQMVCPDALSNSIEIVEPETKNTINNCSLQKFYSFSKNQFGFIILKGFQNNDLIEISNIKIKNNICNNCYYGLMNILGYNLTNTTFSIKKLEMENNQCGFLGCLSIFQSFNNSFLENTNSRILNQNNQKELEFQLDFFVQLKLLQSSFVNNTATYGAACFFSEINVFLQNCVFISNFALQKGGAIFFHSNNNKIFLTNSQIVQNEAQIAGGIHDNQSQIQQENVFNLILNGNEAKMYASNILSIPSKLALKINGVTQSSKNQVQNSTTIVDVVTIIPYYILGSQTKTQNLLLPSGLMLSNYQYFDTQQSIYIPYNFSLRLLAQNQKDEQMLDLSGSSCKIYSEIINNDTYNFKEFNYTEGTLSQQIINFNLETGDYNMDNLIIYFNPKANEFTYLQLAFKCDSIQIPQYNSEYPYELQNIVKNYYLVLKLRTFECQLGEYFNTISGGCVQCDTQQNQYSITKDATQCEFKDQIKMMDIKSAMINLREGYWRAFYYSRIIEGCYHLELNCLGGWIAGDVSCNIGHIGALCEQCDIYNIRGLGSYSQSQNYSCSDCTKMATNILNIVIAFLWTLLSIFLSVNSTIKMIDEFIMYTKLKAFGKYLIFQAAQISILIKVFTNYLQIINSLSTFQLSIPIGITIVFQSVGNPIETVSFSLDCYFVQITNLTIIYVRILWGFAQVGIFISLFLILHLIITILNKQKMSLTYLTTTLIYIYIYLSPNIVSGLIALMSYRTISGEKWVTSNVSYLYENQQHFEWLVYFILPAFILVSILLPLFFFTILFYHRKKIHLSKIRKVWGYLYNEYKQETYYWEIIKIVQKELIILILVYYVDYVSIKSSLIFFLLYLYGYLTTKYRPYQTGDLNQIDSFQTTVCKISIILAQTIYSAQNLELIEIQGPFYFFLAILNLIFIVQIMTKIFFAYFDKLYQQIDLLKAQITIKFPYLVKSNKYCIKIFENTTERKQTIRQRFLLIKSYLLQQARQIINYKKLNNFDFQSNKNKENSSWLISQTSRHSNKYQRINTARLSNYQLSLKQTEQ